MPAAARPVEVAHGDPGELERRAAVGGELGSGARAAPRTTSRPTVPAPSTRDAQRRAHARSPARIVTAAASAEW